MVYRKPIANCEDCVYYDYDEQYDAYLCTQNLDQDELASLKARGTQDCPYFKFDDEYKSIHRQI